MAAVVVVGSLLVLAGSELSLNQNISSDRSIICNPISLWEKRELLVLGGKILLGRKTNLYFISLKILVCLQI